MHTLGTFRHTLFCILKLTFIVRLGTVQSRERVRVPDSITGTLSSVHIISGTISTLIDSITAHCSGGNVHCDGVS